MTSLSRPITRLLLPALAALLMASCANDTPVTGFVIPAGDASRGQQVFIRYKCYSCHTISGVELPPNRFEAPFVMPLGTRLHRVTARGELLTAVVNPDHVISAEYEAALQMAGREPDLTPMPSHGDIMTVNELIDLVAFLHQHYARLLPAYDDRPRP